jgi:hypothetical protein
VVIVVATDGHMTAVSDAGSARLNASWEFMPHG